MPTLLTACPDRETLHRYLLGNVAESNMGDFEHHLAECTDCLASAQTAFTGDTLIESLRARAGISRDELGVVDLLIARLRTLPGSSHEASDASNGSPQAEGSLTHDRTNEDTSAPAPALRDLTNTAPFYEFLRPGQSPDEIGRLGPYRVLKPLGHGGMGLVFAAEDPQLRRVVALKVMQPALAASEAARQRFLREARAAAAVEHDHIVAIFQVGEDNGVPFLAMQLLKGECLDDRLKRDGRLPTADVLRIGRETAEGLAAAHRQGLIHRDVKPSNIWLEEGRGRVKLLDFGLARAARQEGPSEGPLTKASAIVGTPAYMAPEQARGGDLDPRCDLFSLGCVLYRMGTGRPPFQGKDSISTLVSVSVDTPAPPKQLNPDLPAGLSNLIERLLAKRPEDRPPSADAVVEALHAIARTPTAPAGTAGTVADNAPQPPVENAHPAPALASLAPYAMGANLEELARRGASTPARADDSAPLVAGVAGTDVSSKADTSAIAKGVAPSPSVVPFPSIAPPQRRGRPIVALGAAAAAVVLMFGMWVIVKDRKGREVARFPLPENGSISVETRDGTGPNRESDVEKGEGPSAASPVRAPARSPVAPDPLPQRGPNESLSRLALVGRPATLPGVRSWTVETKQHRWSIRALAVSPDNTRVATGGEDGAVRIWDIVSGRLERTFIATMSISAMNWSPDSARLAVKSGGNEIPMQIWDVAAGRVVRTIPRAALAKWSAQSDSLAIKEPDRAVRLLDADGVRKIRRWEFPFDIHDFAFSPDGKSLAVAFYGGQSEAAALIDVSGATPPAMTASAGAPINQIAWSPDGRLLAGTGQFGGLFVWDAKSRELRTRLGKTDQGAVEGGLAWLSNDVILHLRGGLSQWSVAAGSRIGTDRDAFGANKFAVSPDGRSVVLGDWEGKLVCLEVASPKLRWNKRGYAAHVGGAVWSPRGDRLAFVAGYTDQKSPRSRSFVIDAATGTPIASRRFHAAPPIWDPAGERVLIRDDDHHVVAWGPDFSMDAGPFATSDTLLSHQSAISPDGVWFAAALDKGGIGLWKVGQQKAFRVYAGEGMVYGPISWSPDSKFLAVVRLPANAVSIYDPNRDGVVHVVPDGKSLTEHAAWAVWSRDGRTLVVAGSHMSPLSFWDTSRWTLEFVVNDLPHSQSLRWIPDGGTNRIALFGEDLVFRIYSADMRELERSAPGYFPDGQSPDGRVIAGPENTAVYFWEPLTGRRHGTWVALESGRWFVVSADGHVRTSHPEIIDNLSYLVETDEGQKQLTPAEFDRTYGWKNDPDRVRLVENVEPSR